MYNVSPKIHVEWSITTSTFYIKIHILQIKISPKIYYIEWSITTSTFYIKEGPPKGFTLLIASDGTESI